MVTGPGAACVTARATYDLTGPAYDHDHDGPPERTVLLRACRSGSTLLGEALHATGRLGCPLEYFFAGMRPGIAEVLGRSRPAELRPSPAQALHRPGRHSSGSSCSGPTCPAVCRDLAEHAERYQANLQTAGAAQAELVYGDVARLVGELFLNPSIKGGGAMPGQAVSTSSPGRPAAGARSLAPTGRPWREPAYDRWRRSTPGSARSCTSRPAGASSSHGRATVAEVVPTRPGPRLDGVLRPLLAGLLGDGVTVPAPRLRRQSDARTERILARYLADRASTLTAR